MIIKDNTIKLLGNLITRHCKQIQIMFKRPKFKIGEFVRISNGILFGAKTFTIKQIMKQKQGRFLYLMDCATRLYYENELCKYNLKEK